MRKLRMLAILALVAGFIALVGSSDRSPAEASSIDTANVTWSVQYLIDQSQTVPTVGGKSQFSGPRDNRGLALSPDNRYLYLGYNNPSGTSATIWRRQVRKIDTTIPDYTLATVAILERNRGKALATDDQGRVYMAEGSDTDTLDGAGIHVYDANLATKFATIPIGVTFGLAKPEGVAATREGLQLVIYVTDRTNKTLTRLEVAEPITGAGSFTRAGLDGDGQITITGASDLRGVEVDPSGRIWMADIGANKVFRVASDGTGLTSVVLAKAIDIAFDDTQAFVTQYSPQRTITVLKQSDMTTVTVLIPPWAALKLDPDGQSSGGALSGIDIDAGLFQLQPRFYVANEAGQTANEMSTYGRCDAESDAPVGCTITDTTHDDNEPVLKGQSLALSTPVCEAKITNGGWIIADNGDRASFGGVARSDEEGNVTGQEEYQDHGPAEPQNVKSSEILSLTCNEERTQATIRGTATIDGSGTHLFQIDVQDLGEPGKGVDTYRIQLDTGYDSGEQVLRGGNVQIH